MADPASPLPELCIVAAPDDAGARLDKFLAMRIGTISRARVKGMILEGLVTRGGAVTTDVSETVQPGAEYRLYPQAPAAATPLGEDIGLSILYEDAYLLVLDKPAGLVVHPAPGNPDGTLVNALIAHCG
ncbi:MAG TPA: S4 domain-containing protein, partial [Acidocella sp.]|nr:S4 domain-containing protein [Acidocella sp.]